MEIMQSYPWIFSVMLIFLALQMGEGYLVDICLIYAMISFLAVVVLTKVYTGVYREKMDHGRKRKALEREEEMQEGGDENGNS